MSHIPLMVGWIEAVKAELLRETRGGVGLMVACAGQRAGEEEGAPVARRTMTRSEAFEAAFWDGEYVSHPLINGVVRYRRLWEQRIPGDIWRRCHRPRVFSDRSSFQDGWYIVRVADA